MPALKSFNLFYLVTIIFFRLLKEIWLEISVGICITSKQPLEISWIFIKRIDMIYLPLPANSDGIEPCCSQ